MIAWDGALLSQQRHSQPSSALYSSLQNIIAPPSLRSKTFYEEKKINVLKKKKKQKDTGLN
jgi:hypothetical protein